MVSLACAVTLPTLFSFIWKRRGTTSSPVPVSVNFHFTRRCNSQCGFCLHTAKTSYLLSLEDSKKGLLLLKQAGMKKINFAGGEPFLFPLHLGELAKYCKEDLKLESVSIVTNGTIVKSGFLKSYSQYVDVIAVSCDSFIEETNIKLGRGTGRYFELLKTVSELCHRFGVKFKVNTAVNRHNFDEDMNESIKQLDPSCWQCFQVLVVEGQNDSITALRNPERFVITSEEFRKFCDVHSHNEFFVAQPTSLKRDSYLILDEYMRFLDKHSEPSTSILEVGVHAALKEVYWDQTAFVEREGYYDWIRVKDTSENVTADA